MPSKQSEAVRRHWEAARRGEAPDDESWGDLTAEPREVDYLETEAGGRPAMWLAPKRGRTDRVLLCLHGGGFVGGSIYTHRKMFGHLAKAAGARALLLGYRLLPEGGGYPVPVDEAEAAYRWLLEQGIEAGHIAFAGDSVGGWLAITTQLRAKDKGLPLPAAALLMSPFTDLEAGGKSYDINSDPLFERDFVRGLVRGFFGPAADLRDPQASPLHADLTGLGPVYIQAAWRRGSTSSPACCTPSRWRPAGRPRPTTRSAGWPSGSAPASACKQAGSERPAAGRMTGGRPAPGQFRTR